VIEVLPNHTYRVERSGQMSVQNEQRLKPYHGSPEAAGQAPPLLEPARQPISRGRRNQPRDWEIFVPDPETVRDTDDPPLCNLPPVPNIRNPPPPTSHQEGSPPPAAVPEGLPPLPLTDIPEEILPILETLGPPDGPTDFTLGSGKRNKRPPDYLADYHVGYLTTPQCPNSSLQLSMNSDYHPRPARNTLTTRQPQDRNSVVTRHPELSCLTDPLTNHVTGDRANIKFKTRPFVL